MSDDRTKPFVSGAAGDAAISIIGGGAVTGMGRPMRLLMHVCCGPCAAWPLSALRGGAPDINGDVSDINSIAPGTNGCAPEINGIAPGTNGYADIEITGLFYNPNIHPYDELAKRLEGAKKLFGVYNTPLIIRDDCMRDEWESYNNIKAARCGMCYRKRLSYTAKMAAEMGFGAFTTTLLISPYQDHDLIASVCGEMSLLYKTAFFYRDFRPRFRDGQNMARDTGLYRQKYCGCIFSQK